MSSVACVSILVATVITAVSVVSKGGSVSEHFIVLPDRLLSAPSVGSGVASVIFAFTGHLAYPQIISEMEKPEQFPRALKANASVQVVMYTISGCIIYWFTGEAVRAPALDSATGTLSKIAWGLALPTIIVAGVLPGMMIIKNAHRGFWAWRRQHIVAGEDSKRAWASWFAIDFILWLIAPVFAEVVPSFMGIVGVAGAFLGAWISLSFPALAWFRIDRRISHIQRSSSSGSSIPIMNPVEQATHRDGQRPGGKWLNFWRNARRNAVRFPVAASSNALLLILGIGLVSLRPRRLNCSG